MLPIYVSVTSISKNQHLLSKSLISIINQTLKPTKIFVYLSSEPSFFDKGFENNKIKDSNLVITLKNPLIKIIWGKDMGPFGKLLPILKQKWVEDCIIITIDDDIIYSKDLIKNLVKDYNKYKCVISYRGFTPNLDNIENFDYRKSKALISKNLYNFPTGVGGILYKPEFFHKTKDLIFDENIFLNSCDKQDDIWFYLIRILNDIDCYIENCKNKWIIKNISTRDGLFHNYNSKNNQNTIALKNTINLLKTKKFFI